MKALGPDRRLHFLAPKPAVEKVLCLPRMNPVFAIHLDEIHPDEAAAFEDKACRNRAIAHAY